MSDDRSLSATDAGLDEPVVLTRRELEALVGRVDGLVARIAELEGQPATERPVKAAPPSGASVDDGGPPAGRGEVVGRRAAIAGLAGVAAAGAAALLGAEPAAAANGANIVLGSTAQDMSSPTGIAMIGTNKSYGLGITDNGLANPPGRSAILGHATGQAFDSGVRGLADGGSNGLYGSATGAGAGVFGGSASGYGVRGQSDTGVAGFFQTLGGSDGAAGVFNGLGSNNRGIIVSGPRGQISMLPNQSAPATTTAGDSIGTLWQERDTSGSTPVSNLWACVADGFPGRWQKLASSQAAGVLHLLPTPVRVYDSRPGTSPAQGPKSKLSAGNVARTIDLKENGTGLPGGTTGVVLTVLLVNAAAGSGNATVWANGAPRPSANTLVWGGTAGRFSTLALTAVDAQAKVQISASASTDVVLDVVAYLR